MNVHGMIAVATAAFLAMLIYMLRRAGVLLVLLAVLFGSIALADFPISRKHFVANQAPGFCFWASLETLGRHHGIWQLDGLTAHYIANDKRGLGTSDTEAKDGLDHRGKIHPIRYLVRDKLDRDLLFSACGRNIGAVVGLRDYPVQGWGHAIILTEYGETVRWRDVNHPAWTYWHTQEWFDARFAWAVVIEP